jgi:outer membrane protein OmpA-like peptidoglycan-associated protein
MAELNVQPKKQKSWWPWLLALLGIIAIIFFLTRGSDKKNENTAAPVATTDSSGMNSSNATSNSMVPWDSINFNTPYASYDEINDKDVTVRAGNDYAIYSVGENILFETNKSTIKKNAEQKLKQISTSLSNRYNGGEIMVYGYTDSKGNAADNKQLAEQRADAVKNWLVQNGNVSSDRISVHPVGESQPVASNETEKGRQQNRRVDIVVRNAPR